jgi:hypothetical protein
MTWVRIWSRRYAPRGDQRRCCFLNELRLAGAPIAGTVQQQPDGDIREFNGWLQLTESVEAIRRAVRDALWDVGRVWVGITRVGLVILSGSFPGEGGVDGWTDQQG